MISGYNTIGIIAKRPVLGWGTGSFEQVYTEAVQGRPGHPEGARGVQLYDRLGL